MGDKEPVAALNLDIVQQQNFVRYFNGLPEKSPSTVRLFSRLDYYTLHGDDAVLAADFTSKFVKYMGESPKLSYVCLNKHQMELFIRELLLIRQYRVEIYFKQSAKTNDWILQYKGSPGNLSQFEEILFQNANVESSNCVMGIKLYKNNTLAIANVNSTDLKFEVCEFSDNECFSELEALLAQISPKECILPEGDTNELKSIRTLLERSGILVVRIKRSEFNADDIVQDLNRLLFFHKNQTHNVESMSETNLKVAMECLQAVINFLHLTGDESNFNQYKLGQLDVHRYVRLDNAALYALNVFPQSSFNNEDIPVFADLPKTHTLFGILNYCVTPQGRRLLEQWIKQPLKDANLINDRLDIVETFVNSAETRIFLSKTALTKIPDLMMLSKKLSTKKAKLQDCYRLYQAISYLPLITNNLNKLNNKCVNETIIDPLRQILADMQKYQDMIEELLDLDLVSRCEFLIKSTVNDEMNELFHSKQKIEEKMNILLHKAANDLGLEEGKSIKLECNPQHGYFFRITKKEEKALRQEKEYKIIDAVSGGVRFTNNKLSSLNEAYTDINEKYEEAQRSMVEGMIEVTASYTDTVRSLNVILATLDVLNSFATASVSAKIPYVRPKIYPSSMGILKLEKVRHPCLEQQDFTTFIPNSVDFDRKEKLFYIVTGPNMCGKSTYIRSIGVCALMAHIGCFTPCEKAEISLLDSILARVGASDSQLKGLSTFMLEMIETSTIIKTATVNSLVIIDELGRGTSTYDGCGIAWSIAEHLVAEIKCFSLFATHLHKITKLSDMYSTAANLHVSAAVSQNSITPLYQIRQGECDQSYGIHCAKIANFPTDVLTNASKTLNKLEHYKGMKYIKNFEIDLKKKSIEDGDKIINESLDKLKSVINDISDEDLKKMITEMKNDSTNNLFIKGLIEVDS